MLDLNVVSALQKLSAAAYLPAVTAGDAGPVLAGDVGAAAVAGDAGVVLDLKESSAADSTDIALTATLCSADLSDECSDFLEGSTAADNADATPPTALAFFGAATAAVNIEAIPPTAVAFTNAAESLEAWDMPDLLALSSVTAVTA